MEFTKFEILKIESYEKDGEERLKFAAISNDEKDPVVFIYDDFHFDEESSSFNAFFTANLPNFESGELVLINENHPNFKEYMKKGEEFFNWYINDVIESFKENIVNN